MKILTQDCSAGRNITDAIDSAKQTARFLEVEVRFEFNGAEMRVRSDSDPDLLYRDFMRKMAGYHSDPVGPYPPYLSDEVKARDAEIEAKNERRRQLSQRAYDLKMAKRAASADAEIAGVEMAVHNQAVWDECRRNNQDGYGGACVSYAERWARLMQARMKDGLLLATVAKQASHDADIEGITGFMYGAAVSILAGVWEYGEALRMWHNLDTQLADEGERANETGGVLNPALLNIG